MLVPAVQDSPFGEQRPDASVQTVKIESVDGDGCEQVVESCGAVGGGVPLCNLPR